MEKLPKLTIEMTDNFTYSFERGLTKQAGELLIEISEVDADDIIDIVSAYSHSDDKLTKENLADFSEWILKELSDKYIYPIAFFTANIFARASIRYVNDRENFTNEINVYLDFCESIGGLDLFHKAKLKLFRDFEKNIGRFANTALFLDTRIFAKYRGFLYLLDYEKKRMDDEQMLIEAMGDSVEKQDIEYRIVPTRDNRFIDVYSIGDLFSFLIFDTRNVIKEQVIIKKCSNCGGYFIPQKRSDAIYCDRPSQQDAAMTCKEYGTKRLWYDRLKDNKSAKLYRNIYMAKQMLAKRHPDIQMHQDDFIEYKRDATQWKKDVKEGVKTDEEYIKWLKSVSGRRYFD